MAIPFRPLPPDSISDTTGVILAIDYGKKRLGLALSDEHRVTAHPFATWMRINRRRDLARLRELVRQYAVRRIVVGLPLHLDGSASEISEEAKSFGVRIKKALGIPVEMMDERLSSWEAKQTISAMESHPRARRGSAGRSESSRKTFLDDVAAAVILRDYLDRTRDSFNTVRTDLDSGASRTISANDAESRDLELQNTKLLDIGTRD